MENISTVRNEFDEAQKKLGLAQAEFEKACNSLQSTCDHPVVIIHNGDPQFHYIACTCCGLNNRLENFNRADENHQIVGIVQQRGYMGRVFEASSPGSFMYNLGLLQKFQLFSEEQLKAACFQELVGKYRLAAIENKPVSSY